jgi:hypothetical protein
MGFSIPILTETLNREFPTNIEAHTETNTAGEKTEDVAVETITINGRPLDRLLVIDYPPAANPNPAEMTQFQLGGEIILVTEGEAEITFATEVQDGAVQRTGLRTEHVSRDDLIISTDTPNNWTRVIGDKFAFIYFVGNPSGPQRYADIPKTKVRVV